MNQPLSVAKCRINGITLEVCYGEIPDIFRLLWFVPITEFELPDTKGSDEDFSNWLGLYRHARPLDEQSLLEKAQCN